jgi:hypothetical protein
VSGRWATRLGSAVAGLALACAGFAAPVAAQNCSGRGSAASCAVTGSISIAIGRATHLTVAPVTTPLTTPTPGHYDAGFAATDGPTLTVRANSGWSLAISSATATWTATNTNPEAARTNKPAGDQRWSTSAMGVFTALSTTPTTVATGAGATAGANVSLFYRTLYSWGLDTPGAYSMQVVFTLSAP